MAASACPLDFMAGTKPATPAARPQSTDRVVPYDTGRSENNGRVTWSSAVCMRIRASVQVAWAGSGSAWCQCSVDGKAWHSMARHTEAGSAWQMHGMLLHGIRWTQRGMHGMASLGMAWDT